MRATVRPSDRRAQPDPIPVDFPTTPHLRPDGTVRLGALVFRRINLPHQLP